MTDAPANPYLDGLLAPVDVELTAFDLEVTGTLPAELDGRYLRNGPNPVGPVDPAHHHWFIGNGMVHGVRLRGGRAEWYRNRWVRSTEVSLALGEEPIPGDRAGGTESANTNVIGLGGRTYAIVEAGGRPVELTDELDSVCFSDFDGTLRHGFTAHPKRDPRTGELHAVNYFWARPNVLDYTVVGPDGRVTHQTDVAVPGNPMTHDCSITETTLALYDLPVTFDLDMVAAGATLPYGWDPGYGARVGLMPLHGEGTQVQWFDVEPCYVFHPVNAWDEPDGRVAIDVVRHPRMFDRDRLGPNEGRSALWRWTFDRAAGTVREEQLDDRPLELPRVDERLVGRRHRYSWAMALPDSDQLSFDHGGMVRYDALTGDALVVDHGPGRSGAEVVFVPRADDAAEDDGWYLTFVHDAAEGRSELVVLDASAPADEPVARVHLPGRVPMGFHGNWIPTPAT